jgi:hypothetical protein
MVKNDIDSRIIRGCELSYSSHENEDFIIFDVTQHGNNTSLRYAEFVSRKNYLVMISNADRFTVDDVNRVTKEKFVLIGYVYEHGETIKIKISGKFKKITDRIKEMDTVNIFSFDRITTQIREFLAIKNLEFDYLNKFIMMPKLIVTESLQRHDIDLFSTFFTNISQEFNPGQMESIKNISLTKQGIKLLQGPPGTGKTHTL